jgi:hypothetical protein
MKMYYQNIKMERDWNKSQQEKYYKNKRRVGAPSFEEGDSVYLRRRTLGQRKFNIKTAKTSTKLVHLQIGPVYDQEKVEFHYYRHG